MRKPDYISWGRPFNDSVPSYMVSYCADIYAFDMADARQPKGNYQFVNWLYITKPTGDTAKFYNEKFYLKK
ncbi:MAG: hypothetical protein IAF38_19225 [Bacteroidia bacterium]|nr:hypothetical protein [Bacteroidia bacterium]